MFMQPILSLILALFLVPKDTPGEISKWLWEKRPLIIFVDSEKNPAYQKQLAILQKEVAGLQSRDVVVLTCAGDYPELRSKYRVTKPGVTALLIGKDGGEKWRVDKPFSVEELLRVIDAMPMGSQEARSRENR